jgi:hypothetical protein
MSAPSGVATNPPKTSGATVWMEKSPNDVSTSWGLPSVTTYVERGICEIIP